MLRIAALPVLATIALVAVLFLGSGVDARDQVYSFIPGEILCREEGGTACYMIYRPPNSVPSRKYIGQSEVRFWYSTLFEDPARAGDDGIFGPALVEGRTSRFRLDTYPDFNWNLSMPCGSLVGDRSTGKLYTMEPIDGEGDPASGAGDFAYSNVFPFWIPSLSPSSFASIVRPERILWVPAIENDLGGTADGNSLPACTIVKQTGTPDFYMVTGHMQTDGRRDMQKLYIGSPEMLNFWLWRIGFYVDVDVSSYHRAGTLGPPPGMLYRTVTNPAVYFSGDDGYMWRVKTEQDALSLGFMSAEGYWLTWMHYVSQAMIGSAPHRDAVP